MTEDRARLLKITLAYDGTRFVGWQRQAAGESIQGLLEAGLARFEGGPVTVNGAGRTDAGVHALGQVASARVSFRHEPGAVLRGLNANLPADIRVLRVEEAPPEFHARFSVRSKTYRYLLRNAAYADPFGRHMAWHVPEPLDLSAMRAASAVLVGTHDFATFRSTGSDVNGTVRTVTRSELLAVSAGVLALPGEAPLLAYEVDGNGFLRHMVRAIVGTLVEVGRGWRTAADLPGLLERGRRSEAGATAPPHGLFLVRVDYD
jgi:tRNA pseudouridine38-40 synthase